MRYAGSICISFPHAAYICMHTLHSVATMMSSPFPFFFCGGDYVKRIIHIHAFVVLLRQQVDETLRCAFHSIFLCEKIVYRSNNVLVMS